MDGGPEVYIGMGGVWEVGEERAGGKIAKVVETR